MLLGSSSIVNDISFKEFFDMSKRNNEYTKIALHGSKNESVYNPISPFIDIDESEKLNGYHVIKTLKKFHN